MTDDAPDFGPQGYLPDRAARRARKIIMRERLPLSWFIASIVIGLLSVVLVSLLLLTPRPPIERPAAEVRNVQALPIADNARA